MSKTREIAEKLLADANAGEGKQKGQIHVDEVLGGKFYVRAGSARDRVILDPSEREDYKAAIRHLVSSGSIKHEGGGLYTAIRETS
jgi:hypothetical protein